MTYPQDPRWAHPGGPAASPDPTGGWRPAPGPLPQQGAPGPGANPFGPAPGYPPHPGPTQYAQPPYGQPPYGQPPYGPAPYVPPPAKSKTGLIVGVVAVVAVVAVGLGVLVWKPWASAADDGPRTETAMLDHDVAFTVEVPAGWKLLTGDSDSGKMAMLVPESETRTVAQINSSGQSLANGRNDTEVHAVITTAEPCERGQASLPIDQWSQDVASTPRYGRRSLRFGVTRVDGTNCAIARGVDYTHSSDTLTTEASDLLPTLINSGLITVARAA